MKSPKTIYNFQTLSIIIILLSTSVLVNSRVIHEVRGGKNGHTIRYERPKKPGAALSSRSDNIVPVRLQTLETYKEECGLGLWDIGVGSTDKSWLGLPFGDSTNELPPDVCIKVDQLESGLSGRISAFVVSGYCECEFFDDDNCQISIFSAFNREDKSLSGTGNGPYNDKVESLRCKRTDHIDSFEGGTVHFEAGKTISAYNAGIPLTGAVLDFTINREQLYTDCISAPWHFPVSSYEINGVTCEFFKDDSCQDSNFIAGNAGKDEKKLEIPAYLRSFKCQPPYGIVLEPRDIK